MDAKTNAYIHTLLDCLAYECENIVGDYRYARRNVWNKTADEFAVEKIKETMEDIEKALEVFEYAEMMTLNECKIVRYCARTMKKEARKMLREYKEGETK